MLRGFPDFSGEDMGRCGIERFLRIYPWLRGWVGVGGDLLSSVRLPASTRIGAIYFQLRMFLQPLVAETLSGPHAPLKSAVDHSIQHAA